MLRRGINRVGGPCRSRVRFLIPGHQSFARQSGQPQCRFPKFAPCREDRSSVLGDRQVCSCIRASRIVKRCGTFGSWQLLFQYCSANAYPVSGNTPFGVSSGSLRCGKIGMTSAWKGQAMQCLVLLHDAASRRNDGLHPELLHLFNRHAALSAPSVIKLQGGGVGNGDQAGPNPVGRLKQKVPKGVVRFRGKPKPTVRNL